MSSDKARAEHSAAVDLINARWAAGTEDFAILHLDVDSRVVWANPAVARVLGYEPVDLVGDTLSRIFTAQDRERGLDRHEIAVAEQVGRAHDDRWHVCKDGSSVYCNGALMALRDPAGGLSGFVKVFRDRTDVRTQTESLENQVAESLRLAGRKDAFLSTLAHELRNPVHAIVNAMVVLRRSAPSDQIGRMADIVDRQAAVVMRLVDDLMDATRIDIGQVQLKLERVILQDAIQAVVDLHADAVASRQQRLRVVVPDVVITLEADPTRLQQILRNLVENAIKYTPPGGNVSITATVEGATAVIRVEDDGKGMAADTLPRIFDLFTRESSALDSATDGLGIGLSVVKKLVQLHHGIVEVQSAGPGRGSEFTVKLPLMQPQFA